MAETSDTKVSPAKSSANPSDKLELQVPLFPSRTNNFIQNNNNIKIHNTPTNNYVLQNKITFKLCIQMITDRMFKEPVARAAKHLASKSSSPVYVYEFGYRGKYSLSDWFAFNGNSKGLGKLFLYTYYTHKLHV